jgi:hypothetical protein
MWPLARALAIASAAQETRAISLEPLGASARPFALGLPAASRTAPAKLSAPPAALKQSSALSGDVAEQDPEAPVRLSVATASRSGWEPSWLVGLSRSSVLSGS